MHPEVLARDNAFFLNNTTAPVDGEVVDESLEAYVDTHSPDISLLLRSDGTILHVSRSVQRICGFAPDELIGTSGFELIHPEDVEYALGAFAEASEHPGQHAPIELLFRTRSGDWLPAEVESYNPPDDPTRFVLVIRDVTDRTSMPARRLAFEHFVLHLAERCAGATAEGLAGVIDGIAAGLGELVDADEVRIASIAHDRSRVTRSHWLRVGASPRLTELFDPEEVEQIVAALADPGHLVSGSDLCSLHQPVHTNGEVAGLLSVSWHRADGRGDWDGGNAALLEAAARILVGSARRAQRVRTLSYQAMHDPLTGLANRMRLFSALDHELNRGSGRYESRLAVAFCDLDDFKAVNDTHGHAAGDELLVEIGSRLHDAVRSGDLVCRVGGDEFVVLCPEIDTEGEAYDIAHRMVEEMSKPVGLGDGTELIVSGSIGVVVVRGHGRGEPTADEVVRQADLAMYEAKSQRNRGIRLVNIDLAERRVSSVR
jgi:diguanylate cyclase (GGDEF)-like protein/PAS domain S-box-containing protein